MMIPPSIHTREGRVDAARRAIVVIGASIILSGCVVGPNFQRPKAPDLAGYAAENTPTSTATAKTPGGGAQVFTNGADVPGQWWTLFGSPALNALVNGALKANPDLQAAQAALRSANETYLAQRGGLWPSIGANYDLSRQQMSTTLAPPLNSTAQIYTLHTPQLTISYTPDVFGGLHRQIESAAAQAEAQRFQTEATYLTLTCNLVAAAIQEASLRDQIDATRKSIALNADILTLIQHQKALGEVSAAEVAAQEAALGQATQALPSLRKALEQQRDLIAALSGGFPNHPGAEIDSLTALSLPRDLPVSLPSQLVDQRPDVRAAEANMHTASAGVGVAIAARLPSFPLTANGGALAETFPALFSPGNAFWLLGANATQPVFEGGALLHKQRAAAATLAQTQAQYRSTVIVAFQNVADVLHALDEDAKALQAAATTEAATDRSLRVARLQLTFGQVNAIVMLNAETADKTAISTLAQARAARFTDTVAPFQALGGGWWNRTDTVGRN
jgi:NodT family efflux transporter outer membrane factor (OMF) lipoprotein